MSSTQRTWMGIAGIAIVVGFFLPWVDFGGLVKVSGYEILTSGKLGTWEWLLAAAYPLSGLALIVASLEGSAGAGRWCGLAAGGVIVLYPLYKVVRGFFEVTGVGYWLVLAGGIVALVGGLVAPRARAALKKAK